MFSQRPVALPFPAAWRLSVFAVLASCFGCQPAAPPRTGYVPKTREITITTVPLLSKELTSTYPFLARDFGPTGMMPGKEVYAFVPSTITVVEGDTLRLQFVNPEDDAHAFVLPDFVVPLPGQAVTRASYVARHRGIFTFTCSVAAHLPSMWGQLVVLSPDAVGGSVP
jgi:plastocyanin